MTGAPPQAVLDAFAAQGELLPVIGGEGRVFRAGPIILKLVDDPVEAAWIADVYAELDPGDELRIPRPMRASSDQWVFEKWTAWERVEGAHVAGRWHEKLRICDLFSDRIANITEPPFLRSRTHPWALADRWAWEDGLEIVVPPDYQQRLTILLEARKPVAASPAQLIHGDLSGNILFAGTAPPAVIDFSPFYRPASYARAIVAFDAVAWEGAEPSLLLVVSDDRDIRAQLLIRAAIFRVTAAAILATDRRSSSSATALASYDRMSRLVLELD